MNQQNTQQQKPFQWEIPKELSTISLNAESLSLSFPPTEQILALAESHERLTHLLGKIKTIFSSDPESWGRDLYKALRNLIKHDSSEYISDFLEKFLPEILEILGTYLKQAPEQATKNNLIAQSATNAIACISDLVASKHNERKPKIEGHLLSFSELQKLQGVRIEGQQIFISDKKSGAEHSFPIPTTPGVMHKGGLPRLLLKIYANAPQMTIEAELPVNDIDLLIRSDDPLAEKQIMSWKADPRYSSLIELSGIEILPHTHPAEIFASRDMTLNSCFLAHDGLHFSAAALQAARLGKIEALGVGRELYGADAFYHQGLLLLKNSGLMRAVKALAERKAVFLDMPLRNTGVDMGIYWLVLARKFSRKPDSSDLLQRMFRIGKRAGQTRNKETSIIDVLDRIHSKYPFFEFHSDGLDTVETARWLARKLCRQLGRTFRKEYGFKPPDNILILPGDEKIRRITADVKSADFLDADVFNQKWLEFLQRCQRRQELNRKS